MIKYIYPLWAYMFSAPWFVPFNKLMYLLSLRGLGMFNCESEYLSGEMDWLRRHFANKKNIVVFDVGANVGDYSNSILELLTGSKVYAFEPHPKNFVQLQKITAPHRLHVFSQAVSDQPGQMNLYDYQEKDGSSHASLYQEVIETIHNESSIFYTINVITLDDFCAEHSIERIDLLKIDIEGNELKCLLGAKNLIASGKIQAIQFEFNGMNVVSQSTFKNFWDLLSDFKFHRILPGGRLLEIKKYSPIWCEIYAYQNIIALKRL